MPVYIRYDGWYVYFWSNENEKPIHFHIAKVLRHILAVMQVAVEEYKELWVKYQKEIHYIDE